ncbi:MAG TPA: ChaN family lipoprotein [Nanoarchaeota archaeon]|nr:ChaN family lipoprotein [Nanoarchaeota archaeon]
MIRTLAGLALLAGIGCAYMHRSYIPEHEEYVAPALNYGSQAVSYVMAKVENSQFVIFGENHDVKTDDLFFAGLMPYFKQHGIEDIAMEIPRTYQPVMDEYLATGEIPAERLNFITWVYNGEKGTILKSARENNMKIWCIDAEESKVLIDMARDITMFDFMRDNFIANGKKAAVLIGSWHIAENPYDDGRILVETLGFMLEQETSSFSLLFDSPIWSVSSGLNPYRQAYGAYDFDGEEMGALPAPIEGCGENANMEQCFDGVIFVPHQY